MSKKPYVQPDTADTVISRDLQVKGDITSDNDIWVDGQIEGDVRTHGNLHIGVNGRISGNLEGYEVHVAGSVYGDILATGAIVCDDTAHINGNLRSHDLAVMRGAVIAGEVAVIQDEISPDEEE